MNIAVDSLLSVEFIYCYCGCGKTRPKYQMSRGKPRKDRPNRYINGHNNTGKKHSEDTKRKIGIAHTGEKCNWWRGDDVKYSGLHAWVRRRYPSPDLCQLCFNTSPKHLANITGIYNRNFSNWKYMCIKCHYNFDNLIQRNLKQYRNKKEIMV